MLTVYNNYKSLHIRYTPDMYIRTYFINMPIYIIYRPYTDILYVNNYYST